MMFISIKTERLELVPATPAILACDQGDRSGLCRILNAAIPRSWPPPLMDDATIAEFIRILNGGTDPYFRLWYWILPGRGCERRTLIGSGGTGSCPDRPDTVMIGYSVIDEFQGCGYATEALQHLIPEIFKDLSIQTILATTFPELKGSIRVLEKNGFVPAGSRTGGSGMGEGTLVYICTKQGSDTI